MKTSLALAFICVALVGCATSSPIQQYSRSRSAFGEPPELISHTVPEKDVYRIYHRASTGFVSIQSIREAAMLRASDFCARQGKEVLVLGEKISQPPYILGNFPRIEIVFAAIEKPKEAPKPEAASTFTDERFVKLTNLKKLLDSGVITQAEFDQQKAKLLAQ